MSFKITKKETENKTIRFPLELISKIEENIKGEDISFSRFVILACEYALKNMEKKDKNINIEYKKIDKKDEQQVRDLINTVISGLEKKEFFIPYEEWELKRLFDEEYAPLHGAYDGDKLVGMAQLYIDQEMLKEFKEVLKIADYKVCELGGNLVLSEYRGMGITSNLQKMQYELGKELGFDYIISMAHPENIGSLKTLRKIGLEYVKTTSVANGHLRDIYCKKV